MPGFVDGPSKKKTVPVGSVDGGCCPGHATAATVAVMATDWPTFEGLGVLLRVTVEAEFTISFSEAEEAKKF